MSRTLDDVAFGRFAAMIGASLLAARVIVLGCDFGLLRLCSGDTDVHLRQFIGAGASILVFSSILFTLATAVLSTVVDLYTDHWPVWLLSATCIGGIGTAAIEYSHSVRLARRQYVRAAFLHSFAALMRVAAVMAVAFTSTRRTVFWTYAGFTAVAGIVQLIDAVGPAFSWPTLAATKDILSRIQHGRQ